MTKYFSAIGLLTIIAFLSFSTLNPAHADTWPQLSQYNKVSECGEALDIAKDIFYSKELYLYAPRAIPKTVVSKAVLGASELDISGGDGVKFDADVFKRLGETHPPMYWQTRADSGLRLVVQLNGFGWRGDQYTLFSVPESVQPEQFVAEYDRSRRRSPFNTVIGENWRTPLILQGKDGVLWAIDVDHPAMPFPTWSIYARHPGSEMTRQCQIYFGPQGKMPMILLPKPVQKLADLLGQTTGGGGPSEGTLQPTARLMTKVGHTWAAVATRPWALSHDIPYNTREEVDRDLLEWARSVKSFYKLYQEIYAQYPTAQKALERYYVKHFGISAAEAKKLAASSLDIAFRSYFVFPR